MTRPAWNTSARQIRVTASVGVAQRRDGESFDDLLARADSALYEAKADGRNHVRVSA
jgi:diguanylate cyclase (GGDEF)-like protein